MKSILPSTHSVAFTIIELLTTISIIAVLGAMLIPALVHGREKARTVACVNNHRQVVIAWTLYAGDHGDRLIPNPDSTLEEGQGYGWVAGNVRMNGLDTNVDIMADERVSWLAPYVKRVSLYKCPSDDSEFVRSISMNCRMNPTKFDGVPAWVGGLGTNFVNFRKIADVQKPSEMLVILDERSDSINDSYFAIDMSNTGTPEGIGSVKNYTIIDFPGDYHNGGMATSFADSHVENHKWLDFVKNTTLGAARPRTASAANDKDVKWLQDHSTYRK